MIEGFVHAPVVAYDSVLYTNAFLLSFLGSIVCAIGLFGFGALHWLGGRVPFMTAAIVLRIVSASGESIIGPAAYTLATRQMAPEHRSKALAIAETAFGSGFMLGPPLGGILYDLGGFYTPFWTNACCLLVVSLGGLFLLRDQAVELAVSEERISWLSVVRCPRVLVGFFSLLASGASGQWFSASLEPYLEGNVSSPPPSLKGQSNEILDPHFFFHNLNQPGSLTNGLKYFCFCFVFAKIFVF